jgi:HSP20 family protein
MTAQSVSVSEKPEAKGRGRTPAARGDVAWPLASLRQEVDRLFENFGRGAGFVPSWRGLSEFATPWKVEPAFGMAAPAVDVTEKDKQFEITAELPGLEAGNIDVSLSGDMLTLKGEKKDEREEKEKNYYLSERRYGSFQRSFPLPTGVDRDKIAAEFDKGVLKITLPKSPEAVKNAKKIPVSAK